MPYVMNVSPKDFYTQRNNKNRPHSACGPTSRVMFYLGNGIRFKNNSVFAHDDYFMNLFNSEIAIDIAKDKFPGLSKDYTPNEIHGMYEWLDKTVCGKIVSKFNESGLTFDLAMDYVKKGKCIQVSGKYPDANINGHIQLIAGYNDNNLLLCDTYGDFRNNYRPISYKKNRPHFGGYGVTMTREQFNYHLKWGETKAYHEPMEV